jgi:hypothetical protein
VRREYLQARCAPLAPRYAVCWRGLVPTVPGENARGPPYLLARASPYVVEVRAPRVSRQERTREARALLACAGFAEVFLHFADERLGNFRRLRVPTQEFPERNHPVVEVLGRIIILPQFGAT